MSALAGWENFYVIMGSSAGALIGLQFVVMTLIANRRGVAGQALAGGAFATPNIVHFGTVVLLSGIITAPWQRVTPAAILWGVLGIAGILYQIVVLRRMRMQSVYRPEFEDWLFHFLLPFAAYAALAGSAYAVRVSERKAMFPVGAAALLLLFVGIHNAWDAPITSLSRASDENSCSRPESCCTSIHTWLDYPSEERAGSWELRTW